MNKAYCWCLTKYNKIVYIDSDAIVIQNIDHMFTFPELSAAQGKPFFNSGVMVLKPSIKTFISINKIMNNKNIKWKNSHKLRGSIHDQMIFGYIFKNKYNKLTRNYNITSNWMYRKTYKNPYIKHWSGHPKPWAYNCNFIKKYTNKHIKPHSSNLHLEPGKKLTVRNLNGYWCSLSEKEWYGYEYTLDKNLVLF